MMMTAAMIMATAANAQEKKQCDGNCQQHKQEMIQKRTDRFVKEFGLSDAQAQQLLALNTAYADKMPMMPRHHGGKGMGPGGKDGQKGKDGKRPEGKPSKPSKPSKDEMKAMKEKMEANKTAYQQELQKILTPEQYAKYQEVEAQRKQQRMEGRKQRGPEGQPGAPEGENND